MLRVIQTDAVWQEMGRRFSIMPPLDWEQKIRRPFHFATKKIHVSYNKQAIKNTADIDLFSVSLLTITETIDVYF